MARKATTKATTAAKAPAKRAAKAAPAKKQTGMTEDERQRAAYFNWLNRGAPLWDDQQDWFSVC